MSEHRIDLSQLASIRDGTGHTIFAPSASGMWLNCPGSLIPNLLAVDPGNVDAAYGTVGHSICEAWLREGKPPLHRLGTNEFIEAGDWDQGGWGYLIEIDEEMFYYARQCVDRCEWEPGDHLVERKVWFEQLTPIPKQGGTMDFAAMQPGKCLVTDHKFGKAEIVYAKENSQMMLYAVGIFLEYDWIYHFEDFVLRVNQPRLNHFDEWQCRRQDILDFMAFVKEKAAIAWAHDAPRIPGPKQCRFCKVRATCAANAMMQEELIASAFEAVSDEYTPDKMQAFKDRLDDDLNDFDLQAVTVGTLSTLQLAKLKPFRATAEAWWKAMDAELYRRASMGEVIHGFKLVEARSKRIVRNENKFVSILRGYGATEEEIYRRKLTSPAQGEKVLIKHGVRRAELANLFADSVEKPIGKATLVPLRDPRQPIVDLAAAVFQDESSQSVDPEDREDQEI